VTLPRTETAYAKINLALHVRRRRGDGYHELETLFAFLDSGDRLSVKPASSFHLEHHGRFGDNTGPVDANLVTRAARLVHGGTLPDLRFDLDKQLPVAAGVGGGSADAAATLRLMDAGDRLDLAAALGADVPACMASIPVIGRGTGVALSPVDNDVSGLGCVIVNPMVPLTTGPVFAAWDAIDRGAMPKGSARDIMFAGRNDLETPAIALCPVIGEVLDWLGGTAPLVARMSGSGASCFAIYDDLDRAHRLAFELREFIRPDWWSMSGVLR
jgi:4-diphosphocytidyl-2-C-methyl-D-erythritol kinase